MDAQCANGLETHSMLIVEYMSPYLAYTLLDAFPTLPHFIMSFPPISLPLVAL